MVTRFFPIATIAYKKKLLAIRCFMNTFNILYLHTQGVNVLLEEDILEECILQDSLQLLVHLQGQLQRHSRVLHLKIRQFNNIDFSSEVSTVHKFVYTDEALLLVRQ